ncbi:unnamed protein product [Lupinus luteus]|uniref:Uncharacterized protein n=1 Tax=Lupinus luteus TaxID=3873 RepID=A0AAV1XP35_LUPLU
MNIEEGKKYQIVFYVKALATSDLQISFTGANDAFVSEYAVWKEDAGLGSLLDAVAPHQSSLDNAAEKMNVKSAMCVRDRRMVRSSET